jgi:hypothetical protein
MHHELRKGFLVDSDGLIYLDRQMFLATAGKEKKRHLIFFTFRSTTAS